MSGEQIPKILHYSSGTWNQLACGLPREAEVSLSVNGQVWLSLACTPTHLRELAVGFLFNEGVIQAADEVMDTSVCAGQEHVDIWLSTTPQKPLSWMRTSGCAGGATSVKALPAPAASDEKVLITPQQVEEAMRQLLDLQDQYREVRGMHCSGLSNGQRVVLVAEDIGRHNTVDKLAGMRLLWNMAETLPVLLTTGRVSAEMLQKAVRMGAQVVISRTSPTQRSVFLAQQAGVTLIGYARRASFNIYSALQRVVGAPDDLQALSNPAER